MSNNTGVESVFNHMIHILYPETVSEKTQIRGFIFVLLIALLITSIDMLSPMHISFRNLLLIPVIMVALIERRKLIYLFIGINAFLFANSINLSIPSPSMLPPLVNFLSAFLAYSILCETILLGLNTITSLGKRITDANQEISELKKRLENAQTPPNTKNADDSTELFISRQIGFPD